MRLKYVCIDKLYTVHDVDYIDLSLGEQEANSYCLLSIFYVIDTLAADRRQCENNGTYFHQQKTEKSEQAMYKTTVLQRYKMNTIQVP